jgi:hypothetical protein
MPVDLKQKPVLPTLNLSKVCAYMRGFYFRDIKILGRCLRAVPPGNTRHADKIELALSPGLTK